MSSSSQDPLDQTREVPADQQGNLVGETLAPPEPLLAPAQQPPCSAIPALVPTRVMPSAPSRVDLAEDDAVPPTRLSGANDLDAPPISWVTKLPSNLPTAPPASVQPRLVGEYEILGELGR